MSKDSPSPLMPYEIMRVDEQMGIDPSGKLVPHKVVYFRTAYGDTGNVRIPKENFTAEAARLMVEEEVREIQALRE